MYYRYIYTEQFRDSSPIVPRDGSLSREANDEVSSPAAKGVVGKDEVC